MSDAVTRARVPCGRDNVSERARPPPLQRREGTAGESAASAVAGASAVAAATACAAVTAAATMCESVPAAHRAGRCNDLAAAATERAASACVGERVRTECVASARPPPPPRERVRPLPTEASTATTSVTAVSASESAATAPWLWTRERAPVAREGAPVADEGERHDNMGERCDDVGEATMKRHVRVRKYNVQGATCVSGSAATTR
jgi:hypothetical protein